MWSHSLPSHSQVNSPSYSKAEEGYKKPLFFVTTISLAVLAAGIGAYSNMSRSAANASLSGEDSMLKELVEVKSFNESDRLNTTVHISSDLSGSAATPDISINKQPVVVPDTGVVNKTIQSSDGTTKIDISIDSNSDGSSQTNTSSSIQLDTTSDYNITTNTE